MKKLFFSVLALFSILTLNAQNQEVSIIDESYSTSVSQINNPTAGNLESQAVFIANKGQVMDVEENFHPEVKYMYSDGINSMYFENNRVVCVFAQKDNFDYSPYNGNQKAIDSIYATLGAQTQRIDIEFVGASNNSKLIAGEKGSAVYHYFLNDRENIGDVSAYGSVTYKNLYPNIDIVFHQYKTGIKYDIILHPGAKIEDVKIRYNGASSLQLNNNLVTIETKFYEFTEELPLAFFNDDSKQVADVKYVVDGDAIGFSCNYSNSDKLIIDPTLTWATFFETSGALGYLDYDHNVADTAGNLYISGYCNNSANTYPTVNPGGTAYVQAYTSNDLYIAKFSTGRSLVWATYFGGSNSSMDWALGTEVMAIGGDVLHIVGDELATNGPFLNGGGFYYNAGAARPYYARFNKNTGVLLHCTNISGGYHPSIAISPSGLVAIILHAYDFNTVHVVNRAGAYNQAANGGFTDLFLMLFNSSYTQTWGTFLGGPGTQENGHAAFDANNNLFFSAEIQWMSGSTIATEHLVNPGGSAYYQTATSGEDIMIGKFTSAGVLIWNTLYGGNGNDGLDDEMGNGTKVIVSPTYELIVIGGTSSTDFPLMTLTGAYNQTLPANVNTGGSYDDFCSFILKFSNTGVRQWATYWGENSATAWALLYDGKFTACNQFVLAARASFTPTPLAGYYNKPAGGQSFLMQFNSSFAVDWSSYVGDNTSTPQISYSLHGNRLYLTTRTYANEATVDPGGGAYYDDVKTGTGSYIIWEFNMAPSPALSGLTTICEGETITWTASTTGGTWSSSNTGVATINPSTGEIVAIGNGTTTITYTSSVTGCPVFATADLTVTSALDATITPAGPFCLLDAATTLTAANIGGVWAGTGITNTATGTFDPATAGVGSHEIIYTTSGSCPDADTITIVVASVLDATITPAGPFCISDIATNLTAANTGGTWSGTGITNTSNGTFDPTIAGIGTHEIVYTTSGSCSDSDTIQVSVVSQLDATIAPQSPVCDNEAAFNLSAANPGGTWTGTGITSAANGTFDPSVANEGTHTIVYTILGGCGDIDSVDIVVNEAPDISYVSVDESCTGAADGSIDLTISGGTVPYTYTWSPSGSSASLSGLLSGNYVVTVTDANGCSRNQTVVLGDPGIDCDGVIPHAVVPNAFSPNGDGENDMLFVLGEGVTMLNFIVYDRWGEKVFETTSLGVGWDGTFRGKELDAAVFSYYMNVTFVDGTSKIEKGDITLVK